MNETKAIQNDGGLGNPARRQRFTLVEMMVVIVIIAIVIGISIPAFQKMGSGSAVRAGTRVLAAQIRLTRQYAISQRRTIALLVPANEVTGLADNLCYVSMKPAIVEATTTPGEYKFIAWVEDTRWSYIPRGAVVAELDDDVGIANGASAWTETPSDTSISTVAMTLNDMADLDESLGGATTVKVRAIVFSPTGRVLFLSSANATVAQITYIGGNWISKNQGSSSTATWCTPNQFNIGINSFTGRIKIVTPDEYP